MMCPEFSNQNGHWSAIKGNWGGGVKEVSDNLLWETEKRLGYIDESVKIPIENNLRIVI